jgi:hypothetical protein
MESFDLLEEPLEPTALEVQFLELAEAAALVHAGVVRKSGTFDEIEDDGILETGEDTADSIKRERVISEDVVGLHGEDVSRECGVKAETSEMFYTKDRCKRLGGPSFLQV